MHKGAMVANIVASLTAVFLMASLFWGRTGLWLWGPVILIAGCLLVTLADTFSGGYADDEDETDV